MGVLLLDLLLANSLNSQEPCHLFLAARKAVMEDAVEEPEESEAVAEVSVDSVGED